MTNERIRGEELVRRLLDGSLVLDEMKREVEQVVRMTIGFLKLMDPELSKVRPADFADHNSRWHIGWEKDGLSVSCWIPYDTTERLAFRLIFSGKYCYGKPVPDAPTWVQREVGEVRKTLHVFVDGMAREYPRLPEFWWFIVDAGTPPPPRQPVPPTDPPRTEDFYHRGWPLGPR